MKKQRLIAVFAAMAFAALLAGCQQPSSGGDSTTDGNTVKGSTDFSKAAVGDIVLKDGTFVKPENFTDEMKDKAAAVIVRTKSGDTPALGVGIHHNRTGLAWCTNDANAYNVKITDLQSDNCKDGSDGWEKLKAACDDAGKGNDETLYPAWNFCNTYAATYGLTGDLADGWYLPTVAELETIDSKRSKINESLKTAGGNQFEKSYYWSCCQSFSDKYAYELYFGNGSTGDNNKYNDYYVCSVRAFN